MAALWDPPSAPGAPPRFVILTTDANGSAVSPGAVVYQSGALAGLEATDAQGVDVSVEFTAASC